jgi:hypothetical protein
MKGLLIALVFIALVILLFIVFGSTHQQVPAPQQTPAAAPAPDASHKKEMEDHAKNIADCALFIEDYRRYTEHSPREQRRRKECGEYLGNAGISEKMREAIVDAQRNPKR